MPHPACERFNGDCELFLFDLHGGGKLTDKTKRTKNLQGLRHQGARGSVRMPKATHRSPKVFFVLNIVRCTQKPQPISINCLMLSTCKSCLVTVAMPCRHNQCEQHHSCSNTRAQISRAGPDPTGCMSSRFRLCALTSPHGSLPSGSCQGNTHQKNNLYMGLELRPGLGV